MRLVTLTRARSATEAALRVRPPKPHGLCEFLREKFNFVL